MAQQSSLDANRLQALIEAGRLVVAERQLDAVFGRLLDVARETTGARYAAIGILDESRTALADFITAGIDPHTRETIGELPRGRGVLGTLISEPKPLRLRNVSGHPRSYGFPVGHPPMESFLGVPIVIRDEVWGNLYLTDKEKGEFDAGDEEAIVVLASWAAVAVDNARLYWASERRSDQLGRSVRELEATTEIAAAVGGETTLERVLELIVKRSRALVEAEAMAIVLTDGDEMKVAAVAGRIDPSIVGARISSETSVAGRVAVTGRPERVDFVSHSLRFALRDLGVEATAALFVPLMFRNTCVGVLEAFDRVGGPEFEPDDERILSSAAASAATAVATAQTVARHTLARTMRAAEDERRRWARELHDETLQALAGLRVMLSTARSSHDPELIDGAVRESIEQISTEITNLRALITELRPAALDELGLSPALGTLGERMQVLYGIRVEHDIRLAHEVGNRAARLDAELETVIYRVVQEALQNAARHAGADKVRVTATELGDEIAVEIVDDGHGFDTSKPTPGFGLTGMRERVALVGGNLEVTSSSGGTTIRAVLPVMRAWRQTA
jgi:signal transduction histidine kinase